jgi:hypothetical protein
MPEGEDYEIKLLFGLFSKNIYSGVRQYTLDVVQHTQRLDKPGHPMEERGGVKYGIQLIETIDLDVRPKTPLNRIDLTSNGPMAVAVLGNAQFNARMIEGSTLRLGVSGTEAIPLTGGNISDVNFDGYPDFVSLFSIQDLGIAPDTTPGTIIYLKLTGQILNNFHIEGEDTAIIWHGDK